MKPPPLGFDIKCVLCLICSDNGLENSIISQCNRFGASCRAGWEYGRFVHKVQFICLLLQRIVVLCAGRSVNPCMPARSIEIVSSFFRDRPIYRADIWVLPIYRYRPRWPIWSASVGVDKTLLYHSRMQTICARKNNKPSQDSYLAATMLAGAFS